MPSPQGRLGQKCAEMRLDVKGTTGGAQLRVRAVRSASRGGRAAMAMCAAASGVAGRVQCARTLYHILVGATALCMAVRARRTAWKGTGPCALHEREGRGVSKEEEGPTARQDGLLLDAELGKQRGSGHALSCLGDDVSNKLRNLARRDEPGNESQGGRGRSGA